MIAGIGPPVAGPAVKPCRNPTDRGKTHVHYGHLARSGSALKGLLSAGTAASWEATVNLGNKLAVGEAVDLDIGEVPAPEIAVPEPARPARSVLVVAPDEPVPAHAER